MVKDFIFSHQEKDMKVNYKKEKKQEKAFIFILMETLMKDFGIMTKNMDKARTPIYLPTKNTKENGLWV